MQLIDSEKYSGYVKLARSVKLSVYKHASAWSGVATSRLALRSLCGSRQTGCAWRITPIYMWRKQAIIERSWWSDLGELPLIMLVKLVNSWQYLLMVTRVVSWSLLLLAATDTHFYLTSEKIRYQEENDCNVFESSCPAKYKSNCTEDR